MTYKLIALDLDGTLLDEDKIVGDGTLELIREARDSGAVFTIATGRMYRGATRYAELLEIDVPVITYNGAVIRDPISNEVYREFKVPASGALSAVGLLKEEPVLRYVFIGEEVYTDTPHDWTEKYADLLGVAMNFVGDVRELLDGQDPVMLVFMVPDGKAPELTRMLKDRLDSQVRITNSTEWFLDVLHPKASKGLALKQLADSLGIAREKVIAIGDNRNDLEMVEYAGLGVAVANATDDLKAVADYVTELPLHEGVEEVIMRFVLSAESCNHSLFATDAGPYRSHR